MYTQRATASYQAQTLGSAQPRHTQATMTCPISSPAPIDKHAACEQTLVGTLLRCSGFVVRSASSQNIQKGNGNGSSLQGIHSDQDTTVLAAVRRDHRHRDHHWSGLAPMVATRSCAPRVAVHLAGYPRRHEQALPRIRKQRLASAGKYSARRR